MSAYGKIRKVYTLLLPHRVRRGLYLATPRPLREIRRRLLLALEKTAHHEELYHEEYFKAHIDPVMRTSAQAIADSIVRAFSPERVVDIGCGTGLLLLALETRGVRVEGVEYSAAAVKICRERGLNVHRLDLEKDALPSLRADVAVSTEVAEHLPAHCADRFVDMLCASADRVVMTAATPGQGGTDHVNEQPHSYWIEKFQARGYGLDPVTLAWRDEWREKGVAGCYWTNVLVFRKGLEQPVGSHEADRSAGAAPVTAVAQDAFTG